MSTLSYREKLSIAAERFRAGEASDREIRMLAQKGAMIVATRERCDDFRCGDCGVVRPVMFRVSDELWSSVAERREILCARCFEKRLGRELQLSDLTRCPLNDTALLGAQLARRESRSIVAVLERATEARRQVEHVTSLLRDTHNQQVEQVLRELVDQIGIDEALRSVKVCNDDWGGPSITGETIVASTTIRVGDSTHRVVETLLRPDGAFSTRIRPEVIL